MIYFAVVCFVLLLYAYIGFPILVALLARLRPRPWRIDETIRPTVSIVLAAFNEEVVLRRCLQSLISQEYPSERLEILCGSDGSTDKTNLIIAEFAERFPNVRPILFPHQRGKMLVLNDLVALARNQILFFVDADVTFGPKAVLHHVRHYSDPAIGAVAGRLKFVGERSNGVFESERTYWSIESSLRQNEAQIDSTMGLFGGNYSMRRGLWSPLPGTWVNDDFYTVLSLLSRGHRIVYDSEAVSEELYGRSHGDEFKRKWRNASQSLTSLTFFPSLLYRYRSAWMLWPHKVLRWFSGYLTIGFVTGSVLAYFSGSIWLSPILFLELACAVLALLGWLSEWMHRPLPLASQVFWLLNIFRAGMKGVIDFAFPRQRSIWAQATRVADIGTHAATQEVQQP